LGQHAVRWGKAKDLRIAASCDFIGTGFGNNQGDAIVVGYIGGSAGFDVMVEADNRHSAILQDQPLGKFCAAFHFAG